MKVGGGRWKAEVYKALVKKKKVKKGKEKKDMENNTTLINCKIFFNMIPCSHQKWKHCSQAAAFLLTQNTDFSAMVERHEAVIHNVWGCKVMSGGI